MCDDLEEDKIDKVMQEEVYDMPGDPAPVSSEEEKDAIWAETEEATPNNG